MSTGLPRELQPVHDTIFVCLGIFANPTTCSRRPRSGVAQLLDTAALYMEGGDTWLRSHHSRPSGTSISTVWLTAPAGRRTHRGVSGTFTEGCLQLHGGNSYIDHLAPLGSAFTIFRRPRRSTTTVSPTTAAAIDGRTSFESAAWWTPPARAPGELLERIMGYFGVDASVPSVSRRSSSPATVDLERDGCREGGHSRRS